MARRQFLYRGKEAKMRKLGEIARHGEDCTCRDEDCVELRGYLKEWRERTQPMRDAIDESTRITAADLAVTINTRAHDY